MLKTSTVRIVAACLAATLSATVAQSKFSGIYAASSSQASDKILIAITKGGHVLGLSNSTRGLKQALDPAKSTINADGKFKGITADGNTIITGTVSSDFKFRGTGKNADGGETFRITGSRTLD